jgi:hypothetical protein
MTVYEVRDEQGQRLDLFASAEPIKCAAVFRNEDGGSRVGSWFKSEQLAENALAFCPYPFQIVPVHPAMDNRLGRLLVTEITDPIDRAIVFKTHGFVAEDIASIAGVYSVHNPRRGPLRFLQCHDGAYFAVSGRDSIRTHDRAEVLAFLRSLK